MTINPEELQLRTEQKQRADAVEAVRAMLNFPPARLFIKELFRMGEVGETPDVGLPHEFLRAQIGRMSLGREIYKLVSEGDHQMAALILAEVEKERQNEMV